MTSDLHSLKNFPVNRKLEDVFLGRLQTPQFWYSTSPLLSAHTYIYINYISLYHLLEVRTGTFLVLESVAGATPWASCLLLSLHRFFLTVVISAATFFAEQLWRDRIVNVYAFPFFFCSLPNLTPISQVESLCVRWAFSRSMQSFICTLPQMQRVPCSDQLIICVHTGILYSQCFVWPDYYFMGEAVELLKIRSSFWIFDLRGFADDT